MESNRKERIVENWIPQQPFVSNYNITDENFDNFEWKTPNQIIPDLWWYVQRAIWTGIIPQESIHVVSYMPSKEYLSYLSELKWKKLDKESIVKLKDIKWTADNIIKKISWKSFYNMNFISSWTAQELMWVFTNSGEKFRLENVWLEENINCANSKSYLRHTFGSKMVKWEVLNVYDYDFRKKAKKVFNKFMQKWFYCRIRLDRSVSGVGSQTIKNEQQIDELCNLVKLDKWHLWQQILFEAFIPEIETSPSCQGYVDWNGNVEIYEYTDQILDDGVHQWNVILKDRQNLMNLMNKTTNQIWKKMNKELGIKGFFGADFLLIDTSKVKDIESILWWKVDYFQEGDTTYALVLCEVNRRMTWAYASSLVNNLYPEEVWNDYVCNINTITYNCDKENSIDENFEKVQDKIILALKKNWLLFEPWRDKWKYWVYPFSVQKGKIQVAVVAKSQQHKEEILKSVSNVLDNIKS